tara:strand:- start:2413 stop:3687 length:1275 start_codon:yes stop_codon:yes gene_type:complete
VSISPQDPAALPRWKRLIMAPIKLLLGMAFTKSILGAMIAIGWTQRLMQRNALAVWWKRSLIKEKGTTFPGFLDTHLETRPHLHWPNWFLRQNFLANLRREGPSPWRVFTGLTESLRRNFWLGLQGIFNTSALILPSGTLMWFGWDYGWNMSFHKGYEQFYVGVTISSVGFLAFVTAMFYVPLAQARQAVTGQWRTFYDFRLVWRVAREQWAACLGLAIAYVLLAVPLNVLKTAPMFLYGHGFTALEELVAKDPKGFMNSYFFWTAVVGLPAYILVRCLAARIYAAGLLRALREKQVDPEKLSPAEQSALDRLELLTDTPPILQSRWRRLAKWFGTKLGRALGGFAIFWLWAAFQLQVYFAEFLNYHEAGRAWLNHPLVQLPWFQYLPTGLQPSGQELPGAIGFILLCAGIRALIHLSRKLKNG